jgi:hypothetical protein
MKQDICTVLSGRANILTLYMQTVGLFRAWPQLPALGPGKLTAQTQTRRDRTFPCVGWGP